MPEIKPALTAKGWEEFLVSSAWAQERVEGEVFVVASDCGGQPFAEDVELDAHETAAKCLHGQPFGFTWEDVFALRGVALLIQYTNSGKHSEEERLIVGLSDRIAALLPPRETDHA